MNMRSIIEVANDQVDHVGEALQVAFSGGLVFHNFDNAVKAFANGVAQVSVDEGKGV